MIGTDVRLNQLAAVLRSAHDELDSAVRAYDTARSEHAKALSQQRCLEQELEALPLRRAEVLEPLAILQRSNAPLLAEINGEIEAAKQARKRHRLHADAAWTRNERVKMREHNNKANQALEDIRDLEREKRELLSEATTMQRSLSALDVELQATRDALAALTKEIGTLGRILALTEYEKTEAKRAQRLASRAFHRRIDWLRSQRLLFQEAWPSIAESAGVPDEYIQQVRIKLDAEGNTNIFFGGTGAGDHAHYALDSAGQMYYRREIGAPHGPQNYLVHRNQPEQAA